MEYIMSNKDILLDLFCSDRLPSKDVAWADCQESLPFYDLDFAMLRIKMHTGSTLH